MLHILQDWCDAQPNPKIGVVVGFIFLASLNLLNSWPWDYHCPREENMTEIHYPTVKINEWRICKPTNSDNKTSGVQNSVNLQNIQRLPPLLGKDREMDSQNVRKSPRLSVNSREMDLQNSFECSEKGIDYLLQSQKKGSESNNFPCPIEVELTVIPQVENGSPNYDVCLVENFNASSQKSFKSVPSFEYYVSSGKGINLIVDLNSSPSGWTKKRFENAVWCNSKNLQLKQFQSFRQEIECLGSNKMKSSLISKTGSVNKIRISHVENETSPKSVSSENFQVQFDLPDGDNGSLDINGTKSCSAAGTGDGSLDNSRKVNFDTCGDHKSTCAEESERRNPVTGTEASDLLEEERSESSVSDGSHKRKRQGREINGVLLRSGMRLGARRSMRLSYK